MLDTTTVAHVVPMRTSRLTLRECEWSEFPNSAILDFFLARVSYKKGVGVSFVAGGMMRQSVSVYSWSHSISGAKRA